MNLDDFAKLLIADTRRAAEWMATLDDAGIAARRVEAHGADAEKAEWQILVPAEQVTAARKLVSEVLSGKKRLRRQLLLGRGGWFAIVAILVIIVGLLLLVTLPLWGA